MLEQPNEMIKNEKKVTNNYILDTNSKLKEDFKSAENDKELNNSNKIQKIKKGIISILDKIIFKDNNDDEKKDNIDNHFKYNNNNTFNNNNNRRIFNHQKTILMEYIITN